MTQPFSFDFHPHAALGNEQERGKQLWLQRVDRVGTDKPYVGPWPRREYLTDAVRFHVLNPEGLYRFSYRLTRILFVIKDERFKVLLSDTFALWARTGFRPALAGRDWDPLTTLGRVLERTAAVDRTLHEID